MTEYSAIPVATSAPFDPVVVALVTATEKTVLQVATPSTTDIAIVSWGVSFDGATGAATPVICQLIQTDVAATVTSLTPGTWGNDLSPASLCVGGTSATGYNASVEGTIGAIRLFDAQHVHPQSGYALWYPEPHLPKVPISKFLRIRCKAPAGVDVIPWIVWREPSI